MSRFILFPGKSGAPELVGGKAHGLQQLARLGLNVPKWITVTTKAMEGPRLTRALERGLRTLRVDRKLAVRSSAVGEDGKTNSYAGQLRTTLNVDARNVFSAVRDCWVGAFSERAVLYRQARGLDRAPIRMAVVIQEMVDARVSGVAVTADPLTGAPALVITAGLGLGEGVVTDAVETETYVRELGAREWQVDGRARRILTNDQLDALAAALGRIEESAGCPQDVEWAFDDDGVLWILQARPMTAQPDGELAIWDDSNIGESYPGLTLPLTSSYVRLAYERLFSRALRLAGVPRRQVKHAQPNLANLVGSIRGRLYFNLVNYYRLFLLIPGLERTAPKWETAVGITRHVDPLKLLRRAGWSRLWTRLLTARTAAHLVLRLFRLHRDVRHFHLRVDEMLRRYGQSDFRERPIEELGRIFEEITDEFLDEWVVLILNDFFAFLFNDRLGRLCSDVGEPDLHQRLLARSTELHSLAPLHSVLALVAAARSEPGVVALLRSDRAAEVVWVELGRSAAGDRFRKKAEEHLRTHGERTIQELKLESPSLTETPWVLVSIVRNHLDLTAPSRTCARPDSAVAERELEERFRGLPLKRWYARWLVRWTRAAIADREAMSYARARAYGVLRRLFRAMGVALARGRQLGNSKDVFYLTLEELKGQCELGAVVARRKADYETFATETLPHRIACRGPVSRDRIARCDRTAPPSGGDSQLHGVPCSPGRVRGIARVLHAPSPGERVDGAILVAPVTDPGWIFLMLGARGLVVERGSILSHTAILGRELGIPTIVGAESATQKIASGDEIEIDGSTGEIHLLRRA